MADARTWVHDQLTGRTALTALLKQGASGVRQYRSFDSVLRDRPYVSVRLGEALPRVRGDGVAWRGHVDGQAWVHDDPGSYLTIDAALAEIKTALEEGVGDVDVIGAEWLGTSPDLEDPEQGSIVRYCRFRVIHTTRSSA